MSRGVSLSEGILTTEAGAVTVPVGNLPTPIPFANLPATVQSASRQIVIALWATPKVNVGPWTAQILGLAPAGITPYGQSSGAQSDAATFDFSCSGGTWTLDLLHLTGTNRGIYTIAVDGVTAGTVDGYAASAGSAVSTLTGIVLTAGAHTLRFTMATKNASSSSYFGTMSEVVLTQTA